MTGLTWKPVEGDAGAIIGPDGRAIARYDYGSAANNPYFSEITPLDHRGVITNHAPWDHSWHHGLWWSWKFVNDILFWEDNPDFGGNRAGLGRAVVTDHRVGTGNSRTAGGTIALDETLEWRVDATSQVLMDERRRMHLQVDEHLKDSWRIDWQHEWTARVDCRLEVTPYPEHWWGGYAGLNLRAARSMRDGERIASAGDRVGREAVHGEPASWASYSGNVDGSGTDDPAHPARATFAIFDHPANALPMSVYVFSAQDDFGFLASAPLMHESLQLAAGQKLVLQYRTSISGSDPTPSELDSVSATYRDTPTTWKDSLEA